MRPVYISLKRKSFRLQYSLAISPRIETNKERTLCRMHAIETYINLYPAVAWIVLIIAFVILAKSADVFVESAVALANRFNIPKLVIGLVLVSFATTAPELAVSLISALKGNPEMALGNAIGSVVCNSGLALALAGILAAGAIAVIPSVLLSSGLFLLATGILSFLFVCFDYTLSRLEGATLVVLFCGYLAYMYRAHRKGKLHTELETEAPEEFQKMSIGKMLFFFALGIAGIIFASEFIVSSATSIARSLQVPEAIIALTLVAFGTSVPEVASCVVSARKGHGDLAVGNVLGANILNICWVAGASSIANTLTLNAKQVFFMFPAMFIIVIVMLGLLRLNYSLNRWKGVVLIALYAIYLVVSILIFPGSAS